jgi:hypothetical protein
MIEPVTETHTFRRYSHVIELKIVVNGSLAVVYERRVINGRKISVPMLRRPTLEEARKAVRLAARHFAGLGYTEIMPD